MKRLMTLILASLAIASCGFGNHDPQEPVNYNPKYSIDSDLNGNEFYKTVFVESETPEYIQEEYTKIDGEWEFKHKQIVERKYDDYRNTTYSKSKYFDKDGALIQTVECRYEHLYFGYTLFKTLAEINIDESGWKKYSSTTYRYSDYDGVLTQVEENRYNEETQEYEEFEKESFAYYNGILQKRQIVAYDSEKELWISSRELQYIYDQYYRVSTITTEDKVDQSKSFKKTYYY